MVNMTAMLFGGMDGSKSYIRLERVFELEWLYTIKTRLLLHLHVKVYHSDISYMVLWIHLGNSLGTPNGYSYTQLSLMASLGAIRSNSPCNHKRVWMLPLLLSLHLVNHCIIHQ